MYGENLDSVKEVYMVHIPYSTVSSRYTTCSAYSNEDLVAFDPSRFEARYYQSDDGECMPFRLFVPHNYAENQAYPLVVYLHGGQGRGNDNLKQISRGNTVGSHIFTEEDIQSEYPSFVLVPQTEKGWHALQSDEPGFFPVPDGVYSGSRYVLSIIEELQGEFSIDRNRLYFVGQSLGALGVWDVITKRPWVCAAGIPLDGHIPWTVYLDTEEGFT